MECNTMDQCFDRIEAYCQKEITGHPLLVNTENAHDFQCLVKRMQLDGNKTCVFVHDYCGKGLPQIDAIFRDVKKKGCFVVIGLSSYVMLLGKKRAEELMARLQELSVAGHVIVLLSHMKEIRLSRMQQDQHLSYRVLLLEGDPTPLPSIYLASPEENSFGQLVLPNIQALFEKLEQYDPVGGETSFAVRTSLHKEVFSESMYSIRSSKGIYKELLRAFPVLKGDLEESWGTKEDWERFAQEWKECLSWGALAEKHFGIDAHFSAILEREYEQADAYETWLYWLLLKVQGASEDAYLSYALGKSRHWQDLWEHIFLSLSSLSFQMREFEKYCEGRKRLLEGQPIPATWVSEYQDAIAQKGRDAIWYLFAGTAWEEKMLFQCLADYDYTKEEVMGVLKTHFPDLFAYMKSFTFTMHQKVPERLVPLLTKYFDDYKWQKLMNHLTPDFKAQVNTLAEHRVYNQFPIRSLALSQMKKENTMMYFVDALGVEYLSYISEKCKTYGLLLSIQVVHGELPSITSQNTEFMNPGVINIKDLDALKHESQTYNYEKQKIPLHLVAELKAIDGVLQTIRDGLLTKEMKSAIIISDHGATRLAVLNDEEYGAEFIVGESKGQHSGRCCQVEEDPGIPFAAYENGYAVLANYMRFKGSRKADVEVHGGATLEETLVPLLQISLKPKDPMVEFQPALVQLRKKEVGELLLVTNFDMADPYIIVNGKIYRGKLDTHRRRAIIPLPDMKRTHDYMADIYDGDTLLKEQVAFHVKKEVAKDNLGDIF
ncbi:MAG: BREX-4 system phosphatase PglZ [Dialister sp.]|nr:BREX-4 system phosphatase PglZ [Dialister sp.]